ncbi:MAG: adenylate/guanylate cyclase domain-containing protein, partial [Thermodesulfobacteriota bacterium]|nr:adenylate/guanylate cyclase domain-containing protein [Thermodesulfobacteriota bacterium]
MKCSKCQSENPKGIKFCGQCGAELGKICPYCTFSNPINFKFCGECGHDLRKPFNDTSVDYSQPKSYTPKYLAEKILTTRSSIEGERKFVTVFFADVANYTTISWKLDPEEVHQIMDGCFKILMDEIHKYEGTINQFTGDGIMALFGAPVAFEGHAQRACYAALSIQKAIGEYSEKIKMDLGVDFKIRIGINSGPVIVGSIGDDLRMDYTAIGDTTNLAYRMEDIANPGTIVVSSDTHKITKDFFEFRSLGKVQIKGKEETLEAYELIETGKRETRIEAAIAKGLSKFVGRQREIVALKEAFEKARWGSGQVVGIVGEAGVGKSRLLLELRGMLPQDKYTYLEGRCLHYGVSMAYLPLLNILRTYFDIKEGEREYVIKKKMEEKINKIDEKLKGILAPLHDILSLKVEDEEYLRLEPHEKRERTFESIRDLLIGESQTKPLILAIEDLQWIDKTTEEFLTYLIGWLAKINIFLICLYRPEYRHIWGSKSYYTQIGVGHLSPRTSTELLQYILDEAEVALELSEFITYRAGGNPLFVEEFTYSLLESGSIQREDHLYVLSKKAYDIQVPDSIQGIIAARMDLLDDNLKRTMQVASVIGSDFSFRILQMITEMGEELKSHLLDLQGSEFIYEKNLFPELEYTFKHTITQQVAYNSLLLKRRKEIHGKIGKAIEELYSDRLEEFYEVLAYHYSRSDDSEKAYQYLKLSGNQAIFISSNWEAFRFYKEAINVLTKSPENEKNKKEQISIRLLLGTPMVLLGFPEDSLQILIEGEKFSKELRDEKSLATFYSIIGLYHSIKGDPLLGVKYGEICFHWAHKTQDIELMAPIAFDLCAPYYFSGEFYKIVDMIPNVLPLLEKTHRESEFFGRPFNLYCALNSYYGYSMGILGNFEEGKVLCEKAFRFAQNINHLHSLGWTEFFYGLLFNTMGDGERAVEHLKNSIIYCEEGQSVLILGHVWTALGYGYYLIGESEVARKHMERGLKMQIDAGLPYSLSVHYCYLSMIYLDSGDMKNALRTIEEAVTLSQKNNEKSVEGQSRIRLGRIMGKVNSTQTKKAEKQILQGISILNELKIASLCSRGFLALGELYADNGQKKKGLENLIKAQGMFQEMNMDYWLNITQGILERLQNE